MMRLTLPTAFRTPLPPYRAASPSRSSSASRSPVEAPDGTAARPNAPPASVTSTSTVGFPRESRISRAWTRVIFTTISAVLNATTKTRKHEERNNAFLFRDFVLSWLHFVLAAAAPSIRIGLEEQ